MVGDDQPRFHRATDGFSNSFAAGLGGDDPSTPTLKEMLSRTINLLTILD